ncbi:hypothetical protein EDB19DRAFT_1089506 [Suillus lakei]|nr:hypothetical protein EDB19DRAFT_1089506 [Suillus lakei]
MNSTQDREAVRIQEEERRQQEEGKLDIQGVLCEIQVALRALQVQIEDRDRRWSEDVLEAVRAPAREEAPPNVQVCLDGLSTALTAEVQMLIGEVDRLREERRNIQYELGYLMTVKARYGPGGEFYPHWRPPMPGYGGPDAPPPPPNEPGPTCPAWHTIPHNTRRIRRPRPDQPPPSEPGPVPMGQHVHSWGAWNPNPALAPTPPSIEPRLIVPDEGSPGLFGPRSFRSSPVNTEPVPCAFLGHLAFKPCSGTYAAVD